MPFNPSPTGYFPNINTSGVIAGVTGVFIPYSNLESYNLTTAVSQTGDIRQLVYSFLQAVSSGYNNLSTSGLPNQMTIQTTATVPSTSYMKKVYSFSINVGLPSTRVIAE